MAEAIEDVGGHLKWAPTGASLRVRAEDLPLAIEMAGRLASRPDVSRRALAWAAPADRRGVQVGPRRPGLPRRPDFPGSRLRDHPYARDPRGTIRDMPRLTLSDIQSPSPPLLHPRQTFLVAVGDSIPGG